MIDLIDVSHWQDPSKLDVEALKKNGLKGIIARASYGKGTADNKFGQWCFLARSYNLKFGAYHFYRQIHSAESQLAVFQQQLDRIGGLQVGDIFPVLDMEENQANGDGQPNPKTWNRACDEICDAWENRYGGCILYMSSYFPEWVGAGKNDDWKWMLEGNRYFWLADYGKGDGYPRMPYTTAHIHQGKPRKIPEYANGTEDLDCNFLSPNCRLDDLCLTRTGAVLPTIAADESKRGWQALSQDDINAGFDLAADGATKLGQGLSILAGKK